MTPRMTNTASAQGFANMLVCAVGVWGTWLIIGWIVWLFTGKPIVECGLWSFAIVWVGCLVGLVTTWLRGLSRRGSQLLNCGPHPTRWLLMANAIIFLAGGVSGLFFGDQFGKWGALFALSFSAFWALMATGRLAVYERGIWAYWAWLPWNRIQSYTWAKDDTLLIQSSGQLPIFRSALSVPCEYREAFSQFLKQFAPGAEIAPAD